MCMYIYIYIHTHDVVIIVVVVYVVMHMVIMHMLYLCVDGRGYDTVGSPHQAYDIDMYLLCSVVIHMLSTCDDT